MQTLKESTASKESSTSNWSMFYFSSELITMMQKDSCSLPQFHYQIILKTHINNIKDFNLSFRRSKKIIITMMHDSEQWSGVEPWSVPGDGDGCL